MNSVMSDLRPKCLVIDEIDGALCDGKGAVDVILKMVSADKRSDTGTEKSEQSGKTSSKKKRKDTPLLRPVICICNDLYAPALRQLRQVAKDLKNNSLEGLVPESFGAMKYLRLLSLENNQLQGTLPKALNKDSLEIRTSGNQCLSFSLSKCYDANANASIDAPKVSVFDKKKQNLHSQLAIVLSAVGGVLLVFIISVSVFLYSKRKKTEFKNRESVQVDLQMINSNSAKAISYKKIKASTRNFKQVLGRGSFGSVYLGKLPDGKQIAVKVRFDKTQLGADSFLNEMAKQTMGFSSQGINCRADQKLYHLQTPQNPIVRTATYEKYRIDDSPLGTNAIVAVLAYSGYDMEDAMVLNKSSVDRGFAHGHIYQTESIDLADKKSKCDRASIVFRRNNLDKKSHYSVTI